MSYAPYPRATLLIPTGKDKHLFIVVTYKCSASQHLLFSVSSVHKGIHYDPACEFSGGEHEFIRHHSYVFYREAQQKAVSSICKMIESKYYSCRDDLKEEYFKRVCDGAKQSRFIKPWVLKYFLENCP